MASNSSLTDAEFDRLLSQMRPEDDLPDTEVERLFTPATTLVAQLAKAHADGRLEERPDPFR